MRGPAGRVRVTHCYDALDGYGGCLKHGDLTTSSLGLVGDVRGECLGRDTEPHNAEEVFKAGTPTPFLGAALKKMREGATATNDETGAAHWTADHLPGDRHGIGIEFSERQVDVASGGRCVKVDSGPARAGQCDDGSGIGEHAGLMICHLAADQSRISREETIEMIKIEVAVSVHLDEFEMAAAPRRVKYRSSLGPRRQDAPTGPKGHHGGRDGLGDGRGEHQLARRGTDEVGHLAAGILDQISDNDGLIMRSSGISLGDLEDLSQRLDDLRSEWGGGGVIEVGGHLRRWPGSRHHHAPWN